MSGGREWTCLRESSGMIELDLRVAPNAPRSQAEGLWNGPDGARLKLRIKAPPVEGKANEAVIAWAAGAFGLRQNQITLARGEKGRAKTLRLDGISLADASRILDNLLPTA